MQLQNRVAPDGAIFADPARGLLMGNRGGVLHDSRKQLTARRWASKQWIACALTYKDRHETIMAPRRYTQLFFLDEATALAAGHRPCALCRRADFLRFMEGWQRLHGLTRLPKVAEVDAMLHAERLGAGKGKVTFAGRLGDLPPGVVVAFPRDCLAMEQRIVSPSEAAQHGVARSELRVHAVDLVLPPHWGPGTSKTFLVFGGKLLPWSPRGYGRPAEADPSLIVQVLTPASVVKVIAAGYQPMLHPSALVMSAARSA